MTTKELLMVTLFAVASVILITGRVVSASSWSEDVDQDPSMPSRRRRDSGTSDVVVSGASADGRRSWTVRRRVAPANVSSSSTASRVTPEQWRHRERNKQRRLFTIQQQIMASLGLTRRPKAPRRVDRNLTDADIERLLPLLKQQPRNSALNDTDSARLYVVKRAHALLPDCLVPSTRTRQVLDSTDVNDHDNSRSQTSRSRSGPMRLYFNMAELTDGARRSHVHVKAATLRLHWTGHLPPLRRSRERRDDVTGELETSRVLARRRRPPGDGPASRTWNSTSVSPVRLTVYQLTRHAAGVSNRQGGLRPVKSVRLRDTGQPGWVSVDVKSAARQWIKKPRRNFGFQVVVKDASRRRRRREYDALSIFDGYDCCNSQHNCHVSDRKNTSGATTTTSPTLDVILLQRTRRRPDTVGTGSRRRPLRPPRRRSRDRRDVTETDEEPACTMETMLVSFEELGFEDVILAPKRFVTGYCYGSCPTSHDGASLDERNSDNERYKTGCVARCVPSQLSPLQTLQLNEHNRVSLVELTDVIVSRCDCLR